jgi:hypothetical protein
MITDEDRLKFLKEDLYNTLRYLFEGAIAWDAWKQTEGKSPEEKSCPAICRHQGVLGMYTTFMEARALYDFFHKRKTSNDGDNALADHFALNWTATESHVYSRYMARRQPVNKRMFHLVYGRSTQSGETVTEGPLKEQVLNVAKDLRDLTGEFIKHIDNSVSRELADR